MVHLCRRFNLFGIFGHKKDKYPVHHEDHIVHNTGLFSSFKGDKDSFHKRVKQVLDYINRNNIEQVKKQYSIVEFEKNDVVLVLGNYRGMAMVKKYNNPGNPMEKMLDYSWETCWLSYGFDYKESTTYKWYISPLPEVITKGVFEDIYAVMHNANDVIGNKLTYMFSNYTVKDNV